MQASDLILSSNLSPEEAHAYLAALGFEDPPAADLNLQRLADLVGVRERLARFLPALLENVAGSADPDLALGQLESFLDASPNALTVLSYLEENPLAVEVLTTLLGSSPFLTQILRRNPEYFYWLMDGGRLDLVADAAYFDAQAGEMTKPFGEDIEVALDALRRFRRRETLRIAAQDLLGRTTLEASIIQVSNLADSVLELAYQAVSRRLFDSPAPFAVLGLGKLGGRELNFSSDVDLIYVHANDADHSAMLRFGKEYTRVLTEFTGQGHLYRVDLRLRPMGKTGEIAYAIDSSVHYYQTWADTFDRLALIKCRPVAGDRRLGDAFVSQMQDFVFRKYWDTAALEEIKWAKKQAEKRLRQRDEVNRNIKLGEGGIREIEFFVQAFQLLYGGLHAEIRTPSTLQALDRLVDHGYIYPKDYQALRRAYIYFRDLENKLQLVHDLQTHTLPDVKDDLEKCARRMGYRGKPDDPERATPLLWFRSELESHARAVRRIYDSLLRTEKEPELEELILNSDLPRETVIDKLRTRGVTRPEEFYDGLLALQEARAYPYSPARLRNLLANLLPRLVQYSRFTNQPDRMLSRFDRLCEAVGSRVTLYSELVENPTFGERLFKILAASEFLSETLVRNPELLDSVARDDSPEAGTLELLRLEDRETNAGRDSRNGIRLFKKREEFRIALQDLFSPGQPAARASLTSLAETCLARAVERAVDQKPELREQRFAILGMGKFGGRELTYHSDLDLVFVYDDRTAVSTAARLNDLVNGIREELEGYTEAGAAYKVDFRLRPEGKHGPLAVPFSILREYFLYRAESWERIAWVKSRVVLARGLEVPLADIVSAVPLGPDDVNVLAHIRDRKELEIGQEEDSGRFDFKVGRGGLLDIQFVVQYLQFMHRVVEPNSLAGLQILANRGFVDETAAATLREGLLFLFTVESTQRLLQEISANSFSRDPDECAVLARYLGFNSGSELIEKYQEQTARIRAVFQSVFH